MTVIGLIRHGVTDWNKEGRSQGRSDIPLNDEGIEMAHRIAKRLAKENWDVIYTSPLQRAKKTAEIIALNNPEIELVVDERLIEVSGGLVEGTTEAERIEKWGQSWKTLDMEFEPHEEIIARGTSLIEHINKTFPGKRVLLVSHGSFIKRMLAELLPTERFETRLANTSLTIVELKDQQKENYCSLYNCTDHL
ncbi:histidine phosphatase family protein [Sporosarcina sp. CAU 1771]